MWALAGGGWGSQPGLHPLIIQDPSGDIRDHSPLTAHCLLAPNCSPACLLTPNHSPACLLSMCHSNLSFQS